MDILRSNGWSVFESDKSVIVVDEIGINKAEVDGVEIDRVSHS